MPLKPCQRPLRNAVLPRQICVVTPPSPYALGAPAPSSGGRVHQQCRHYRHRLSLLRRLAKLSGDARPDGRLPAFAWGHVARGRNPYPPHYRMAFASSILLLPHAYQLALRLAFPHGRRTGLPCSVSVTHEWGRRALSTGSVAAHDKERGNPCACYSALLAQALQHLWLVHIPPDLVVTLRSSHNTRAISTGYLHDVSSAPTATPWEMRHGTGRQSTSPKPHPHRRFPR